MSDRRAIELPLRMERRRSLRRTVLVTGLLMLAVSVLVYFPYDPGSVPGRALVRYLEAQAWLVGTVLGWFDASVSVQGNLILGRFPMAIVVDCAALDALAFFAAAVLGFPAAWRSKLAGVAAGCAAIITVNLVRILTLYVAGVHWPALFSVLHEEVLQVLMVATALAAFALWVRWTMRAPGRPQVVDVAG